MTPMDALAEAHRRDIGATLACLFAVFRLVTQGDFVRARTWLGFANYHLDRRWRGQPEQNGE